MQGFLRNPNKDNDYTFRFTGRLWRRRFLSMRSDSLLFRGAVSCCCRLYFCATAGSGLDLAADGWFLFLLLFLPGRLFEAYAYLPLACAAIALACAASRVNPVWAWAILALWMPLNLHVLRAEQRTTLAMEDANYAFVEAINKWAATSPAATTLIYDGLPGGFHFWGATAAWNIAHEGSGLAAYASGTPEANKALATQVVTYGEWDAKNNRMVLTTRTPSP